MAYQIKPLSCDPAKLKCLSEKLIVSHHENNYSGAVKRLNAITEQLASLDFASAPVFTINGLKREELIAANSMILHELYFDSLVGARQQSHQYLGGGSHLQPGRRHAHSRAGHVRAFLSHGFRGEGGGLCRCVYEQYQLEQRRGQAGCVQVRRTAWNEASRQKT